MAEHVLNQVVNRILCATRIAFSGLIFWFAIVDVSYKFVRVPFLNFEFELIFISVDPFRSIRNTI